MAIYETLVRLTRSNETLLHPLIDSKGNFGKVYSRDMAFAAHRYTEVKLDAICSEMFKDIDKDMVDFVDNYDGTMKEPTLLPVTFPNILVNPNQGIAVGMASNIASFNLNEVSLLHKENGKPYLAFTGKAQELVKKINLSFDVSITHTESIATAIVIAFQGEHL